MLGSHCSPHQQQRSHCSLQVSAILVVDEIVTVGRSSQDLKIMPLCRGQMGIWGGPQTYARYNCRHSQVRNVRLLHKQLWTEPPKTE